jgi:septum site-determining protein MinD
MSESRLCKKAKACEAVYEHESGLKIMPASLSIAESSKTDPTKLKSIKNEIVKISKYVILDSAAGLGNEAISSMDLADEIIVVTNPEMPAITDSLKTIKTAEQRGKKVLGVIVTKVRKDKIELQPETVKEMLEVPILGMVPQDMRVSNSLNKKNPVIYTNPKSKAARAYKEIAAKILQAEYDSDKERPNLWELLTKKY